jgi:PAS domain S-box
MAHRNPAAILKELITSLETVDESYIPDKRECIDRLTYVLQEFEEAKSFDFREIGDNLYDGIYITDGKEKTLYVNSSYLAMTGLKAEDVLNKTVSQCEQEGLYVNAVAPLVIKTKKKINAMGESLRSRRKMLISGAPIFDAEGKVNKVVVIDRDVTDLWKMRVELEESQRKMQASEEDKRKKKQEIEHLRKYHRKSNLIGNSTTILSVIQKIDKVAHLDATVLITGETGTGKEVVANDIQLRSNRKNEPFIKINCAAIPANLLESELFGYEKGAFTGASSSGRMGVFELADKGTLLMDEIGEMPMELQAKLLRVIQSKEITRIGGRKPITLDVRIIASTNCNLLDFVKQNKFREDLYYRLNVFPIHMPPLRERNGDIEVFVGHFLDMYNTKYSKQVVIDRQSMEILKQYSWPGNIRELQNIIERLVIVAEQNPLTVAEQVGSWLGIGAVNANMTDAELSLKEMVDNLERSVIIRAIELYGSTRKAAKHLNVDQSTIVKKAKRLGICIA